MRIAVLATALSSAVVGLALADPARAAIKTHTNIAPQDLSSALRVLAADRQLQILYTTEIVANRQSSGAVGEFTVEEALTRVLTGTGLVFRYIDENTITITQVEDRAPGQGGEDVDSRETRVAPAATRAEAEPIELQEITVVPQILVVGSKSLNLDIPRSRDDALPYITFDREVIERSGAQSVDEFLRRKLTAQANDISNAQAIASGRTSSNINLRGLGSEQTLILIDGRRATSISNLGTTAQPDLNGIPLAAIERIEILPATASGIYGGGATGGVVNVILRRDYSGFETQLTYGDSFEGGGGTRRVEVAGGFSLENGRTTATVTASYEEGTELLWGDRSFIQRRARETTLQNNPAALLTPGSIPVLGATTNITSFDGSPLTLKAQYGGASLGAAITSVPYGYDGPGSDNGAALLANAGRYNLDLPSTAQSTGGAHQSLLSVPESVESFSLTVRREVLPWLDAFIDLGASSNEGYAISNPVGGFFFVPGSAAANPFDQDLWITTPAFGTDQRGGTEFRAYRGLAGLIFDLPGKWRGELDYTWSRTRTHTLRAERRLTSDADTAVANGMTSSLAPFDVFRDTNETMIDFSQFLGENTLQSPRRLTFKDASLRFAGPLAFSLPAGRPTVSVQFEHRDEELGQVDVIGSGFVQTTYSRTQTIDSIFLETVLPLIAPRDVGGSNRLELQVAARWDSYDLTASNSSTEIPGVLPATPVERVTRELSSVDPTVSLRFIPIEDIMLRVSYATGFMPPALNLLMENPPLVFTPGLLDPERNNQPLFYDVTVLLGGHPGLKPEQSKSWHAGVIFNPRFAPGLRLSADWVRTKKTDNITFFAPTQLNYAEAANAGLITRGPPSDGFAVGRIAVWDARNINLATATVEAIDLAGSYSVPTRAGTFGLELAATRNLHNTTQVSPGAPEVEYVDFSRVVPWQGYVTIDWQRDAWGAQWSARYFDSYCIVVACEESFQTLSQGSTRIPSQLYHDVSLRYRTSDDAVAAVLENLDIRLGVKNVFNKKPPVDLATTIGYSTWADPRLANYYLSVRKAF